LPWQAEALHRQFKSKKEVVEKQSKSAVMERYGNAARQPDGDEARLLLGQTEGYVEYNAAGRLIKGEEAKVTTSYLVTNAAYKNAGLRSRGWGLYHPLGPGPLRFFAFWEPIGWVMLDGHVHKGQ